MSNAPDEPSAVILIERYFIQGELLSQAAYGAIFVLSILAFQQVWMRRTFSPARRLFWISYISVVLMLSTLIAISNAAVTQMSFVDDRNFPGGPAVFEEMSFTIPLSDLGNACFLIANWLMDAMMVSATSGVYESRRLSRSADLPCRCHLPRHRSDLDNRIISAVPLLWIIW
jgi:hypothetical protein